MSLAQKLIVLCLLLLVVGMLGLGLTLARLETRIADLEYEAQSQPAIVHGAAHPTPAPVARPAPARVVNRPQALPTAPASPEQAAPAISPVAEMPAATPPDEGALLAPAPAATWQAPTVGNGATYFVAASGTATGNGSKAAPFREIRQALPLLKAGDTILIADGQYLGFTLKGINGTAKQMITFKATGKEADLLPTTDRANQNGGDRDTLYFDSCSYLVIEGLRSSHANRAAIRLEGGHHIAIRNCTFGQNAVWGIFTGHTDDLLLEHNECFASAQQHGIYVSNSAKRPVIRANYCHDNAACGIQINADLSCGPDGLTTGAVISDNLLLHNGSKGGAAINLDGVQDSLIANNMLLDNRASGIVIYQHDGAAGPHGVRVLHNTVVMAPKSRYALQIGNTTGKNLVRNNVLIAQDASRGGIAYNEASDVANVDSDYNLFGSTAAVVATDDWHTRYPLVEWQQLGHEKHSFAAPLAGLFVDPAQDHHLAANSRAIGKGDPTATLPQDVEGTPRIAGKAPDLGCYAAQ